MMSHALPGQQILGYSGTQDRAGFRAGLLVSRVMGPRIWPPAQDPALRAVVNPESAEGPQGRSSQSLCLALAQPNGPPRRLWEA